MIATWVIEPWESGYIGFTYPGLIGLGTHLVLLAITGILACLPFRKVPNNIVETAG